MKICVIGAGAIGGLLAAKLSRAGENVSVIVRGAHLAAIVGNGLSLIEEGEEFVTRVKASDRISDVGQQDLIILGMKAHGRRCRSRSARDYGIANRCVDCAERHSLVVFF